MYIYAYGTEGLIQVTSNEGGLDVFLAFMYAIAAFAIILIFIQMVVDIFNWILKHPVTGSFLISLFIELFFQAIKGKSSLEVVGISNNVLLSFLIVWSIIYFILTLLGQKNTFIKSRDPLVESLTEELKDNIVSLVSKKGFSAINGLLIQTTLNGKEISVYNDNFREALKEFASELVKEWKELKFPVDNLSIYMEIYGYDNLRNQKFLRYILRHAEELLYILEGKLLNNK